jgi:hypothetical protein
MIQNQNGTFNRFIEPAGFLQRRDWLFELAFNIRLCLASLFIHFAASLALISNKKRCLFVGVILTVTQPTFFAFLPPFNLKPFTLFSHQNSSEEVADIDLLLCVDHFAALFGAQTTQLAPPCASTPFT